MAAAESTRDLILSRQHFQSLKKLIPELLQYDNVTSIDQALQKASSQFCAGKCAVTARVFGRSFGIELLKSLERELSKAFKM